jgi:Uncharacterized alpha/beta hydrolase domain (DUF2235)
MGKKIVVCIDGTGNEYGPNNTNVVALFEKVVRDKDQIAYYDPGVGTFSVFGRANYFSGANLAALLGIGHRLASPAPGATRARLPFSAINHLSGRM